MERRTVLKSTAVVAATGLAGCSGILGGGCEKPSGDLEDALPSGGEFEQQGDPRESESDNVEEGISANYEGPDGESYFFGISKFEDADTAEEETDDADSPGDGELGYVLVDEYVYFAFGPEKDKVKALLAEAEPLSEGCVDSNVEWV